MTRAARSQDTAGTLSSVQGLWPPGAMRVTRRPGRRPALLLIPSAAAPRMLVPTRTRGAHVMLRRHSVSRRQTVVQNLLGLGVRTGLLGWLPVARVVVQATAAPGSAGGSVEDHVRSVIPETAGLGVLLGPPRANAKPVLQVFDAAGRTIAFGKVGHEPYSAALVRHESLVLAEPRLRDLALVDAPATIEAGTWRGLELLLMTALSSSQQRASSWEVPADALRELAESTQVTTAPASTSPYWLALVDQVAALPGGLSADLSELLRRAEPLARGTELGYGRWHGDSAPWNMGTAHGRLQLWDWERSTVGVPLGFDAVHFQFQRRFRRGATEGFDVDSVLAEVSGLLSVWYSHADQVRMTVLLYVVEILHRYREALGDARPGQVGPPATGRDRTLVTFGGALIDRWASASVDDESARTSP